jgi:hypothetical protein
VVYISTLEWGEADRRLKKGLDLNKKFGDRRRGATADAYRAIMLHKQRNQEEGKEKMLDAIKQHKEIKDWRNLVWEVMSYVWMMDSGFEGDLLLVINRGDFPQEMQYCMKHIVEDKNLQIFVDFWKKRFKPLLLES